MGRMEGKRPRDVDERISDFAAPPELSL